MLKKNRFLLGILLLMLVLSACTPANASTETADENMDTQSEQQAQMPEEDTAEMMDEDDEMMQNEATDEMMQNETPEVMDEEHSSSMPTEEMETEEMSQDMTEEPAWFSAELSNVRNGETFTIHDFKGKVVLVETMAIWCSNCRKQQQNVADLHTMLGDRDDFISLGLDIDPNEDAVSLKDYIEKNGFHWTYAVAPSQVGADLANLYGAQFLNPPSTPMLIVDRQGTVHTLPFGIKSAEQLQEALAPFLADSM